MAAGAHAGEPIAGTNWLSATLNGGGAWRLRGRIPWILGLIMLFDSWDSVAISYIMPSIAKEWGLGVLQSGYLLSAGFGGQFVGAIACGWLAERYGRLPVLKPVVIIMCLLGIACGLAPSYGALLAIRFVQGITIGGATPVAISYINEIAPAATRGRFFGTFQFLMLSGFGLVALSSPFIVPDHGWRPMFVLGALPLVLVPALFRIPESPRWLAARGQVDEAIQVLAQLGGQPPAQAQAEAITGPEKQPGIAALFSPRYRGRSLVIGLLWFLTLMCSFGLLTWVPSLYVSYFHLPLRRTLQYGALLSLFVFVLPLILRATIDRTGRRLPGILGTGLGGIALLTLTVLSGRGEAMVVALTILGQIGVSVGAMVIWPYTAESYDTRVRAVALGAGSSLARAASMVTPLIVGGLLAATGSVTPVFLMFGLATTAVALLWIFATRETAGREIDD